MKNTLWNMRQLEDRIALPLRILELLAPAEVGHTTVTALASALVASPAQIRRALRKLEAEGRARLVRGRAWRTAQW